MTIEARLNTGIIKNYEEAKKYLCVRVRNVSAITEADVVYREYGDLALTYHIVIGDDEDEIASILITGPLLEYYGIDREQLHKDALNNSQKLYPACLSSLFGMVETGGKPQPINPEAIPEDPVLVLTNSIISHGASTLFYPDVMEMLAKALGDYFVIPSSVHEVLILADDGAFCYEDLQNMVQSVNRFEVAQADQLSDFVYHYQAATGAFESAYDYAARQAG